MVCCPGLKTTPARPYSANFCCFSLRLPPCVCSGCFLSPLPQEWEERLLTGRLPAGCRSYCVIAVCARVIDCRGPQHTLLHAHAFILCWLCSPSPRAQVWEGLLLISRPPGGCRFHCVITVGVRFCPKYTGVWGWRSAGGPPSLLLPLNLQLSAANPAGWEATQLVGSVSVLLPGGGMREWGWNPTVGAPSLSPPLTWLRSYPLDWQWKKLVWGDYLVSARGGGLFLSLPFRLGVVAGVGWGEPSPFGRRIHSKLGPRTERTSFKMFTRAHVPLAGGDFRARFDGLPTQAKANYEQLDTFIQLLSPLKWEDQLSSSQRLRLHLVATPAEWNNVVLTFRLALKKVPVLSLATLMVGDELRYVALAVYDVHVAILSLEALKQVQINWTRWADLLPAEFKEWLVDPNILVLMAEESSIPAASTGLAVNNVVATDRIYLQYQSKGVVHPVVQTADGALMKQLAYCFNYFHQPCTPEVFRHLCGEHQYRRWPDHRQPGWKPRSAFDLKVREEFFLFFEATGPLVFVYHLLRHGVVYGDLPEVSPTLPFAQLLANFLYAVERLRLPQSDPLGLAAEVAQVEREEGEALELSDRRLEDEFRSERDVAAQQDHPGYFTSGGQREVADTRSAQDEGTAAGAGGAEETRDEPMKEGGGDSPPAPAPPEGGPRRTGGAAPKGRPTHKKQPGGRSPIRRRHASWPQPPRPSPWYVAALEAGAGRPAPWKVDLRSQLSLPSNNNNEQTTAQLTAAVAAAQFYPGSVPPTDVTASFAYNSSQDLRARLDVRKGLAALAGEASETQQAADIPLDYNLGFAMRTLRAARRGDAAASGGQFACPGEEGDEEAGFPTLEKDPPNLYLTAAERAFNPFASQPVFHGRCQFCSGNHCSRSNHAGTGPNCRKLRQHLKFTPTRRICIYRRCKTPTEHHTPVCGELHRLCKLCGCRGHGEEDGCDMNSAVIMSRLRLDFEESAGLGIYTRLRFGRLEWGFYPVPPTVPPQPVVSYVRLTNLPVLEACLLVAQLTALPQNRVAAVPEALPPAGAKLGRSRIASGDFAGGGSEEEVVDVEGTGGERVEDD